MGALSWDQLLVGATAVVLVAAGLLFLLLVWKLVTRRRQKKADQRTSSAPDRDITLVPDPMNSSPAAMAAAEMETIPVAPLPGGENLVTLPSPVNEELAKTQPSTVLTKSEARTVPAIIVGEPVTLPASGARPGRVGWQIAGLTDTGLKRELNEDNLLILEGEMDDTAPYGLYLVADGMGGHQAGEVASQLIVDAIHERFARHPLSHVSPFQDWLKAAVIAANETVLSQQEDLSQERKMGSTLVMALVTAGQAHIANVGDSRAYRLSQDEIEQISVDHSLVERLVQLGQLTREEARTHRQRNVIYNTIGDKDDPEIGLHHVLLKPGERLLLCSDGLSTMLPDTQIHDISRSQATPEAACKALVEAAKAAGGDDNITAVVIQMDAA